MPREWNFADVWETIADAIPTAPAQVHGDVRHDWRTFDRRAAGVGAHLRSYGLGRHDKVALYLYNTPHYLEAASAAMKASLVPVNTNYRYRHEELQYLWDNADAAAVIFDAAFTDMVEAVRPNCPKVRAWIRVGGDGAPGLSWATSYDDAAATALDPALRDERSGDDPIFIYTGGTTGRPKGVIWRQGDLYLASNVTGDPVAADLAHVRERVLAAAARPVGLPAAPLMHGTGFVFAATILNRGGAVVTLPNQKFDAGRLLEAIGTHRVTDLCIVGDAFARPMADALDAAPGRYDLASLRVISSSGMMWSKEVKARLLAHAPQLVMIDFLNSSEASGMGRAITSGRGAASGARFQLGTNAFVIDDDGAPVAPGSGKAGRVAVRGFVPLGYYKDPQRTAATFPVIEGVRCAVPGDHAVVEADGTITLLGRGSVSINTGGEKVFPEEVEEAIKTAPGVSDAVVVGVPEPRLGQVVAALVAGPAVNAEVVKAHVRSQLAGYKVPRHVLVAASVERMATGKADYNAVRTRIEAWLQQEARS